jgi:hypothetical protein
MSKTVQSLLYTLMFICLALILLLLNPGCSPDTTEGTISYYKRWGHIPNDAMNLRPVGTSGVTYELQIDGKTHKFFTTGIGNACVLTDICQ